MKLLSLPFLFLGLIACTSSQKNESSKLSQINEKDVVSFSNVASKYMTKKNIRAIASTLHNDFLLVDNVSKYAPQEINKYDYVKRSASLMKASTQIKNNTEIRSVTISESKQSAEVVYEIINQYLIKGEWKKSFSILKYQIINSNGSLKILRVDTIEAREI